MNVKPQPTRRTLRNSTVLTGLTVLVFVFSGIVSGSPIPEDTVLTQGHVVQQFVKGMSTKDLVQWIETHPKVDFDTSREMLDELRLAGLSAVVIEAMVARQRKDNPPQVPADASQQAQKISLTLRVNPPPDHEQAAEVSGSQIELPVSVSAEVAQQLGLQTQDPQLTDLALVLFCRTADHVPDHWRSKSPLGRDFVRVQRHRLLAFHGGGAIRNASEASDAGRDEAPQQIVLELPSSLSVELEPDVIHDLGIGLAVEIDGRYLLVTEDPWDDFLPTADTERDVIVLASRLGALYTLDVRFAPLPEQS